MCKLTISFKPGHFWKWKGGGNNYPRTKGVSWNCPGQILILAYTSDIPQSLSGGHLGKSCSVAWHHGNFHGRESRGFLDALALSYWACIQEFRDGQDHHLWLCRLCAAQGCNDEGRMGTKIQPVPYFPRHISRRGAVSAPRKVHLSLAHTDTT